MSKPAERLGEYRDYGYENQEAPDSERYLLPAIRPLFQKIPERASVLEAGCGNGWFAAELLSHGFSVCAFDLSPSGVDAARTRTPAVDFRVASVYDDLHALYARHFDAAFSIEVVEHLYDPRGYVRRVHDVLKPGALFMLTTPYHGYLKNLVMAMAGKMDGHFTALWDGGHIKFWSRRTLTTLLEEAGFEVVDFRGTGRIPFLWKSMIMVARRRD